MELSIKDIKELLTTQTSDSYCPYPVGKNVFIRTVTMAHTGKLVKVTEHELVLEDACWIADTGRFSDFLKTGNLNECEPFPEGKVIIGRGAIVDCCEWKHELPRVQK
jgi:hypothetical protein